MESVALRVEVFFFSAAADAEYDNPESPVESYLQLLLLSGRHPIILYHQGG